MSQSDNENSSHIETHGTFVDARYGEETESDDESGVYKERDGRRPHTKSGDSADEVDPRKLVRAIDVDEIRWYYRNDAVSKTIVDKPVEDAFKHGFSVVNDPTDSVRSLLDDLNYVDTYRFAQKKARRDGFALRFVRTQDTAPLYEEPANVRGIKDIKVLTIDKLTDTEPVNFNEKLPDGYTDRNTVTTDNGIVISTDLRDDRYNKPVGYIYGDNDDDDAYEDREYGPQLIHWKRAFIDTYRDSVDHDTDYSVRGKWEGDSVLQPVIHLIRALFKGNWAAMQTLYRHSSPMHTLEAPDGVNPGDDDWEKAEQFIRNINSKSGGVIPPHWEADILDSADGLDPEPYFDAIFKQICAGTEFTKSVLFGTQTGTVSGSETDIKNYFNQVERTRQTRYTNDMYQFVRRINGFSKRLVPNLALGFKIDWGPLFKVDELDQADAMSRHVQIISQAIDNYVMTPNEARNLLDEQWAEWTNIDFPNLEESDFDQLDRINRQINKNMPQGVSQETEVESGERGTPEQGGRSGGQERGDTQTTRNPTSN